MEEKKRKQKLPKKEPDRFIRVKVVNKTKLINEKDKTIRTCEADGRDISIMDGATVVLSEYAYNNLKTAVEPEYAFVKSDPTKDMKQEAAQLVIIGQHNNYDITELSDWMDSREPKDAPITAAKVKKLGKKTKSKLTPELEGNIPELQPAGA